MSSDEDHAPVNFPVPPGTPQVSVDRETPVHTPTLQTFIREVNAAIIAVSKRPPLEQRVLSNVLAAMTAQYQRTVAPNDPIPAPDFGDPTAATAPASPKPATAASTVDASDDADTSDENPSEEDPDDEYLPPATRPTEGKTEGKTELSGSVVRFTKIQYAVSSDHNLDAMAAARTDFYRAVRAAVSEKGEPLFADTKKGRADLLDTVNYVFSEILGGARNRLINIIKEHQGKHPDQLAPAVAARAENHGRNSALPAPIRTFFTRFALVIRCDTKNNSSPYAGLWRHLRFVQFLNAYLVVLNATQETQDDHDIRDELDDKGFRTRQGHSHTSVVQGYFMWMLDLESDQQRKQFSNYLNNARAISALVETFGPGMLALLPANAYYKLTSSSIGVRTVRGIAPLLAEAAPWLRDLCGELFNRVVNPIQNGDPVDIRVAGRSIGSSVEDLILQGEASLDPVDVDMEEDFAGFGDVVYPAGEEQLEEDKDGEENDEDEGDADEEMEEVGADNMEEDGADDMEEDGADDVEVK